MRNCNREDAHCPATVVGPGGVYSFTETAIVHKPELSNARLNREIMAPMSRQNGAQQAPRPRVN